MDEQSLPRLMTEVMVACQSGNKIICYSKLRQAAKWIMINDPPPDDGPSLLTVELGTPVNDEYAHPEFIEDHPKFAADHGMPKGQQGHIKQVPPPGQGWNPNMVAGGMKGGPYEVKAGWCGTAHQTLKDLYFIDSI